MIIASVQMPAFSHILCVLAERFTPIVGGEKIHFNILSTKNSECSKRTAFSRLL
jgi:hypothetical protein